MLYHGKSSKKSENCIESDDSEKCKEDVLILELVGPSLLDILEQKNIDSFSAKTVLMIGIQAVCIKTWSFILIICSQCIGGQRKYRFHFSCIASNIYTVRAYCSWTTNQRTGS